MHWEWLSGRGYVTNIDTGEIQEQQLSLAASQWVSEP